MDEVNNLFFPYILHPKSLSLFSSSFLRLIKKLHKINYRNGITREKNLPQVNNHSKSFTSLLKRSNEKSPDQTRSNEKRRSSYEEK